MSELNDVRESAFQQAGSEDEFAVCCSDGNLTFASTRDEAEAAYDDMKSLRDSLNPFTEYEYDILDLSAGNGADPQNEVDSTGTVSDPQLTTDEDNGSRLGSAAALMKGRPDTTRKAPTSSEADWRAYFPYDQPRNAQINGIENVIKNASNRGYTLLEGACGTGKTLVGLCAGLELVRDPDTHYERVLCLTSVKQQIRAFEDDLREINRELRDQADNDRDGSEITPDPVSAITLVGKGDICSYTNTGKIDSRSIYGRCEDLREPVRRTAMYADDSKSALRKLANEAALDSNSDKEPVRTNQWEAPYAKGFPETEQNGTDYCAFYAKYRHDTYGQDDEGYTPQGLVTPDDLVVQASSAGLCPHAVMNDAFGNAEVVVANYKHAFDPTTLSAMTGSLIDEQTLVICDEAHMLVPRVREQLSDNVTRSSIGRAIAEMQNRVLNQTRSGVDQVLREVLAEEGISRDMIHSVVKFLQETEHYLEEKAPDILDDQKPGWRDKELDALPESVEAGLRPTHTPQRDKFSRWMGSSGHARAMEIAGPVGRAVARALREASNRYPSFDCEETYSDTVGGVFTRWAECDHEQYMRSIELQKRRRRSPTRDQDWSQRYTVRFQMHNCLPSDEIAERLDQFGGGLLMSATLAPLDVYQQSVGLDQLEADGRPVQELTYGLPYPENNRLSAAVNVPKYTSNNRGKTDERWRNHEQDILREQYIDITKSVIETTPGNVMVTMPSYSESKWMASELSESLGVERDILIDESSSNEITDELKQEFFAGSAKVLTTSILGTLTEGVDYDGDRLSACVVCGVPIQNTRGLVPEAIKTAYRLEFGNEDGFDFAFTVPAVRKARQALGRVIRGHDEAGVRVAIDRRYTSTSHEDDVRKYLPEYEQNDYTPTNPESLRQDLETFWLNA
jgi:DNA excision repair protein ERCC-2